MRRMILAALLAASASIATAAPMPKEQLMKPPAGARHYTISSTAGKHGDIWAWTTPDSKQAYRMSMSLRGWITEDDQLITRGPDGRAISIAIRGFTDAGDATEDFNVDTNGVAHWKTAVNSGSAPFGAKRYNTYGGPWLAGEGDIEALVAAGDKGIDLLPTGHATLTLGEPVQIDGPDGPKTVKLAFIRGLGFSPSPFWLDNDNRFFGFAGTISLLPEGYEKAGPRLKDIQDQATADMVRDVAHKFLAPANRMPTLVDHVLMFELDRGQIHSRSRSPDRGRKGGCRRRRRVDQGTRGRDGDRRSRQDAAPGSLGFAPACRRRLEPAPERRDRNDQLPQPRVVHR